MSGRYIVIFKDSATEQQIKQYAENVNSNGGNVTNVYDSVFEGDSLRAIPDNFLSSLQGDDIIEYIEPDGVVTTQ